MNLPYARDGRPRFQLFFSFFVFLVLYSEIYCFNFHKCGYKTRAVITKERSAIARIR